MVLQEKGSVTLIIVYSWKCGPVKALLASKEPATVYMLSLSRVVRWRQLQFSVYLLLQATTAQFG